MNEEITKALEGVTDKLEAKQKEAIVAEFNKAKDVFAEQIKSNTKEVRDEMQKAFDAKVEEMQKNFEKQLEEKQAHLDKIDARTKNASDANDPFEMTSKQALQQYRKAIRKGLAEKAEEIARVSKGRNAEITIKDMTLTGNLTGDSVNSYQPGIAANPSQKVNFADLVPSVQSATGTYVVYRETAVTGGVAEQATEGALKADVDMNISEIVFNATYLAGITRFSKQMATDLPFLQSFLPGAMRREYFKTENAEFFADLRAAATLSATDDAEMIERLVKDIGNIEAADYDATGIVLNPADWAAISLTKPGDYSLPVTVAYVNGQLVINGVPVFKASWMPPNEYIVGDWGMAKKVVVDGLSLEFFEQDRDNVPKNLITARIESRTVLAIDRPDAFIRGLLTGVQA